MNPICGQQWNDALQRLADLSREAVDEINAQVQADRDAWAALPWQVAVAGYAEFDAYTQRLTQNGVWRLNDLRYVDVRAGTLGSVYSGRDGSDEASGRELIQAYLDDPDIIRPESILEAITSQPQPRRLKGVALNNVAAGRLLPRWECLELCPDCPDVELGRTISRLATDWSGSLRELDRTARLLLAETSAT